MKVSREGIRPDFKPFEIRITVESVAEAKALYAIFNHAHNTQLLGKSDEIRDAIGSQYRVNQFDGEIAMGVSYKKFYVTKPNSVYV